MVVLTVCREAVPAGHGAGGEWLAEELPEEESRDVVGGTDDEMEQPGGTGRGC